MEKGFCWIVWIAGFFILLWGSIEDIKNKAVSVFYIKAIYGLGLLVFLCFRLQEWKEAVIGLSIGIVFLTAAKVTEEKIGSGDAYVIGCLGLLLGYKECIIVCLIALGFSFWVSAFLFLTRKSGFNKTIPLLPFLFVGYLVTAANSLILALVAK